MVDDPANDSNLLAFQKAARAQDAADRALKAVGLLTDIVEKLRAAVGDLQRDAHPLRPVDAVRDPVAARPLVRDETFRVNSERIVAKFESWVEELPGGTLTWLEVTYAGGGGDRVTRMWDKGAVGLTRAQFAAALATLARQCGAKDWMPLKDAELYANVVEENVKLTRQVADLVKAGDRLLRRARKAEGLIREAAEATRVSEA